MQNSTNHNPHRNHQRSRNSTSSSSGFNNIRNRTHSWSNVDKRSTSAKPISAHSRQSSAIIPDSRYRTTSEGNAHFDIKPRSIGKSRRKNSSNQLPKFFCSALYYRFDQKIVAWFISQRFQRVIIFFSFFFCDFQPQNAITQHTFAKKKVNKSLLASLPIKIQSYYEQ